MTVGITAYLDTLADGSQDPNPVLYVERDQAGPLLAIQSRGEVEERFRLPEGAVELVTRGQILEEVRERIDKARLSVAARRTVEQILDSLLEGEVVAQASGAFGR